jgi:hypothetical protein
MRFYRRAAIILHQGAWAGGTPAVTLNQAKDNAGTGSKALAFTVQYSGTGGNAQTAGNDNLVKNTVASNTFNLTGTAGLFNAIEIHQQDLDIANGFAWVQCSVASPGANADLMSMFGILGDATYSGLPSTLPSALG